MKCPHCGKEIANDSVYCEFCGKKVTQAPSEKKDKYCNKYLISLVVIALVHLASLCVAYSVHWETFAYYGIDYEGYPGAGDYNGWFFISVILWLVTLVILPINIYWYKTKKQY